MNWKTPVLEKVRIPCCGRRVAVKLSIEPSISFPETTPVNTYPLSATIFHITEYEPLETVGISFTGSTSREIVAHEEFRLQSDTW